mgnify:CR=1 FL=1
MPERDTESYWVLKEVGIWIIKMIINKIRFGVSAVRILNKFTEDFYASNFTKAYETLGFP